jgi:hypothetical protein
MGNATVTGTVDLAPLEVTSSEGAPPHFVTPLTGDLRINGVMVPLRAESVDGVVNTINRFSQLTTVTASVTTGSTESATAKSSSEPEKKYLVLTSPEHMRFDGDSSISASLGLTGGLTRTSTAEK